MLIPPRDPMISSLTDRDWRVSAETEFDGKPQNLLSELSMHLSFTNFRQPYVQTDDEHRTQDSQIYFQESIVSVHSRGTWVGDVDVLQCLASLLLHIIPEQRCYGEHNVALLKRFLSLETWQDIIDPPPFPGIIRAHGSWLTRLAATVLYIQAQTTTTGEERLPSFGIRVLTSNTCILCYLASERPGVGTHCDQMVPGRSARILLF